jgi:cation:H+ antiporter
MSPLLVFAIAALAVVLAGIRLSHDGDVIAERTGLGGAWVGAILIGAATSLPELATDAFAVSAGHLDLAVGDLFGSSMANMLLLAIAGLFSFHHHMLARVSVNQALVAAIGIGLTSVAAIGVLSGETLTIGPIGWAPILIAVGYIVAMRRLSLNRAEPPFEPMSAGSDVQSNGPTLRRALVSFALASGVILVAARFLAEAAHDITVEYGLSSGVVGVLLLALTTSLPEVTVTVSSIRRGSIDLAVGNLLGSNAINMFLLAPLDVFHGPGSLLAEVDPKLAIGALVAIVMMGLTMVDILDRSARRERLIDMDALLRVVVYVAGIVLLYRAGMG